MLSTWALSVAVADVCRPLQTRVDGSEQLMRRPAIASNAWLGDRIALFSLAAYPQHAALHLAQAVLYGWQANADLIDVYVVTSNPPPVALRCGDAAANVRCLIVDKIEEALCRFADIGDTFCSAVGTRSAHPSAAQHGSRPMRLASFAPLLPNFAEARLGLSLGGYAAVGTVELDVVLGKLAPFVQPYMRAPFDAVALRWAPPRPRASSSELVATDTLTDQLHAPLSTPLLLRNNDSMRRLWVPRAPRTHASRPPGDVPWRLNAACAGGILRADGCVCARRVRPWVGFGRPWCNIVSLY